MQTQAIDTKPLPARNPTRRLFLLTWCAGLPGVIAMVWLGVPVLLQHQRLPVPMWAVGLASGVQSALLLALAAFVGARLAGKVGLRAPAIAALASGGAPWRALRPQCLPGLLGGLLAGVLLWALIATAPQAAAPVHNVSMPLAVRLLYGGVTEEVLVRWGLMSLLVWMLWRGLQRGAGTPGPVLVSMAIAISALVFGLAHLPAAAALAGPLAWPVVLHLTAANAAFGLIAGLLFWRYGLEAAIIAHVVAHLTMAALVGR
ncbi:type II CAAX prenyl endopeptidase Rce1 family protein [Cupriavidus sp. UGS-1]|uniref:CPBP family glutamic-type intramembrane protease n=1 Tax=Cupriavidus sp. UGS-1 TaxID=2899826 RepID=UPI001E633687|nr:CPBP family glutamic-type intramembrane protease [Cupriavidus sp. UGS-1]MCD9121532.1 CPBP family glutamic-type intramembrane protease [Cupriavidus sp. UGS-1]